MVKAMALVIACVHCQTDRLKGKLWQTLCKPISDQLMKFAFEREPWCRKMTSTESLHHFCGKDNGSVPMSGRST
jgi:hypothetical protein